MSRVLISAAHKSSGKTTLSIGLCAALRHKGHTVQSFKKGPDYIDPMWLAMATDRACYNLDFHTMSSTEITALVNNKSTAADFILVEGNKGLYDGLDLDGTNSNAALAKHLSLPVILVLDARGMTRGIAPLVLGYQAFDPDVNIIGVILNQVGGSRHESKLRNILEHYTNIKVIGAVHRTDELSIDERHLGLVPSNEKHKAQQKIAGIARQIQDQVDLDSLVKYCDVGPTHSIPQAAILTKPNQTIVKLGIAQDSAFGFYYPDDLEALSEAGAELIPFSTLHDPDLPDIDGLFIGGGFPETHLLALEKNTSLRRQIKAALENGLPCYAECGGLMYLARSIKWNSNTAEMVGIIPGDIQMHAKPQGRGYVKLQETGNGLWPVTATTDGDDEKPIINAHEFHYSSLLNLDTQFPYAFKVLRGAGIDGQQDGLIVYNTLASYVHLRSTGNCQWAEQFVQFIRCQKLLSQKQSQSGSGQ